MGFSLVGCGGLQPEPQAGARGPPLCTAMSWGFPSGQVPLAHRRGLVPVPLTLVGQTSGESQFPHLGCQLGWELAPDLLGPVLASSSLVLAGLEPTVFVYKPVPSQGPRQGR